MISPVSPLIPDGISTATTNLLACFIHLMMLDIFLESGLDNPEPKKASMIMSYPLMSSALRRVFIFWLNTLKAFFASPVKLLTGFSENISMPL